MRRRTAGLCAAVVGLAVVTAGLVGFPFAVTDPHPSGDAARAFATGDASAYEMRGSVRLDGDAFIRFEGAVSSDGAQYLRTDSPADEMYTELYQDEVRDGVVYRRIMHPKNAAGDRRLELIEDRSYEELVSVTEENGTYVITTVKEESGTSVSDSLSGTAAVVVQSLRVTRYERAGTVDGNGEIVFEPRDGWFDERDAYRVTGADGEVQVDPETYAVTSADVTWNLTKHTDSYLHYVMNRENAVTQGFAYEYTESDPDVETPAWVEEVRNQTEAAS